MTIPCLVLASLLFLAEPAGSEGLLRNRTFWSLINLLVFIAILVYILRNKVRIGDVFKARGGSIREELEQARREKLEAEARLAEVSARLERLDQELTEIKAEADREAKREAERIRLAAEADVEKISELARREIEGAVRIARTELQAFAAEKSVELAESIIRREISPDDNSRLVSRYVDDLSGASK